MACTTTDDGTFEAERGQIMFRGTSGTHALTPVELATYLSDRAYLDSLVPPGASLRIDHRDPRQHRFAQLRTRLAGKTPETAPQLFQLMTERRAKRVLNLAGPPADQPDQPPPDGEDQLKSQHEALAIGVDRESGKLRAAVMASRKDKLEYGFVDVALRNKVGEPIGQIGNVEVFGDMRYVTVDAWGHAGHGEVVSSDSFLSEVHAETGELEQSYTRAQPQRIGDKDALDLPKVEVPADHDGNGKAVVCLDRTWTGDCEYNNTGMWTLRLPLKGSVSVSTSGTEFDWATIQTYQAPGGGAPGKVYATLGTNGGGCTLPPGGAGMSMTDFWQQVTVDPSGTVLRWDLFTDPATWGDFSPYCRLVQDEVYVTMDLALPYVNTLTGASGTLPVTITNAPSTTPPLAPNLEFKPPYEVVNSCLAAGTLVEVDGGQPRKIEELRIGDRVSSPYASGLTITDTATGTERSAMVRILDSRGAQLLMTEMHPLYVVGRGMVAAKHVRIGDRVKTADGSSLLMSVTRERYDGRVFNLKVGNAEEARALGADQTAVYANGFLVGDGQIQHRVELVEMRAGREAETTRLPARWRRDYRARLRVAAR